MRGEATVLHADLDAFYASVEQRDAPELRGRPVIVGGGVVLAASYEAKARGVRTAMGGRQARDLCPEAVVVPPRMEAYSAASKDVFAIFRETTPLVEGLSIDEAFLEVGGLRHIVGTPEQVAVRLRERVRAEVGLAISVGVARTKFLAKVASAVSKPDGLLVVEPDREHEFLLPLPVERLWGVGAVTAAKLHRYGIRTVGELAELVITKPMPSMPVELWGDTDGSLYRDSYFGMYPGIWRQGDWIRFSPDGNCVVTGRSDATLNRGGVRLGTSEFYSVIEELPEVTDSLVVHLEDDEGGAGELLLFVVLAGGGVLDDALRDKISRALRSELSPRHVPDAIRAVPAIPRTLTGKKLEAPVKRLLRGESVEAVASRDSLLDPTALDAFASFASEGARG